MISAKNPDVTKVKYYNRSYEIYDAFPGRKGAEQAATDMRISPYPLSTKDLICKAIVVDLGPDAGRLRYGIFIAKGGAYTPKEIPISEKKIYPITAEECHPKYWHLTRSREFALRVVGKKRLYRLPNGVFVWRK